MFQDLSDSETGRNSGGTGTLACGGLCAARAGFLSWLRLRKPHRQECLCYLKRHRIREEIIEKDADQDQVAEEKERPAHVVADDLAFAAHEFAGGNAHAGGLRGYGLAHFRANRVESRK